MVVKADSLLIRMTNEKSFLLSLVQHSLCYAPSCCSFPCLRLPRVQERHASVPRRARWSCSRPVFWILLPSDWSQITDLNSSPQLRSYFGEYLCLAACKMQLKCAFFSLNKFHKTPRSYFLLAFSSTPVWLNDKKKKVNKVEEPRLVLANSPHTKDSQRLSSVYKTSAEGFSCTGSTFLLLIFSHPSLLTT